MDTCWYNSKPFKIIHLINTCWNVFILTTCAGNLESIAIFVCLSYLINIVLQGKKGVWVKLPIHLVNLVEALVKVTLLLTVLIMVTLGKSGYWLMNNWVQPNEPLSLHTNFLYEPLFLWDFIAGRFLVSPCRTKLFDACTLDCWKCKYYSSKCHTPSGGWCTCCEWKRRGISPLFVTMYCSCMIRLPVECTPSWLEGRHQCCYTIVHSFSVIKWLLCPKLGWERNYIIWHFFPEKNTIFQWFRKVKR